MSAPQWKPGDVALLEVGCHANRRVGIFFDGGWQYGRHQWAADDPAIVTARPLVVIDPEDSAQIERLREAYDNVHSVELGDERMSMRAYRFQAALRSLVTDPKPEEPQGLGAVVEDAVGFAWVRVTTGGGVAWKRQDKYGDENRKDYEHVSAIRVLSEGWSE